MQSSSSLHGGAARLPNESRARAGLIAAGIPAGHRCGHIAEASLRRLVGVQLQYAGQRAKQRTRPRREVAVRLAPARKRVRKVHLSRGRNST